MSRKEARSHVVVRTGPAWPAGAAPVTDWPRLAEAGRGWRPPCAGSGAGGACWRAGRAGGRGVLGGCLSTRADAVAALGDEVDDVIAARAPALESLHDDLEHDGDKVVLSLRPKAALPRQGVCSPLPRQAALPGPRSAHRPRLTPSSGPPRPIGRLGRTGRTHRPSCRHTRPLRSTRTGVARSRSWAAEQAWAQRGPRRVSRCRPRSTSCTW